MKIQKKNGGPWGSGWGVRMDVNEELIFVKIQIKNRGGGVLGGQVGGDQGGCE